MRKVPIKRPSAAMIAAVVALSLSLVGTGVAATISLSKGEKQTVRKIVNKQIIKQAVRGPVTYVTTTTAIPAALSTAVSAACPGGLTVIGGGIKVTKPYSTGVEASYPTTSGWAGDVYSGTATSATTTAICAKAEVTGAPPTS